MIAITYYVYMYSVFFYVRLGVVMHMSNGCSLFDELEECPESDSIGAHAVCTRISLVFDDSPRQLYVSKWIVLDHMEAR
jgi:hypothetical protein